MKLSSAASDLKMYVVEILGGNEYAFHSFSYNDALWADFTNVLVGSEKSKEGRQKEW